LTGLRDATLGRQAKELFASRIPGFKPLLNNLDRIFESSSSRGRGYIRAIDGRRIFVESRHKLLNYLLQSCEKLTCASAILYAMERLDEQGFDWQPLIFYHDEIQIMVREDQAEAARDICKAAFKEGPKLFGVAIMDGEAKIGNNWRDTH